MTQRYLFEIATCDLNFGPASQPVRPMTGRNAHSCGTNTDFCFADLCLSRTDFCPARAKRSWIRPGGNWSRGRGLTNLCHWSSESLDLLVTEATAGIEPAMKVLQTSALPLGYVADEEKQNPVYL